jgi:hypothetical protein
MSAMENSANFSTWLLPTRTANFWPAHGRQAAFGTSLPLWDGKGPDGGRALAAFGYFGTFGMMDWEGMGMGQDRGAR